MLMVYGTMSGTNSGPMMGMPATGKQYAYDFVDIVRFGDDMKMKEHWGVYDVLKMMTDLGMMGGPPQDPKAKKSK
jgi:predicted ester cyclase